MGMSEKHDWGAQLKSATEMSACLWLRFSRQSPAIPGPQALAASRQPLPPLVPLFVGGPDLHRP